jgi:hypothetical protein
MFDPLRLGRPVHAIRSTSAPPPGRARRFVLRAPFAIYPIDKTWFFFSPTGFP